MLTLKTLAPATAHAYTPDAKGWELFTDGTATLAFFLRLPDSPSLRQQQQQQQQQQSLPARRLTVVRAVHVDHYEGLAAPPPVDVALALPGE